MQLSDQILGKGAVATIKERIQAPVLVIGSDKFTRGQLAKTECFNFLAAATLSNILTNHLKVKDTADLFNNFSPTALCLPGLGVISLATLGAAFEQRLGKRLTDYIEKHRKEQDHVVTFSTIKAQNADSKAEKQAKKDEKQRKRSRNRQAHEHRVKRFVERKTKNGNSTTPQETA